MTGNEGNSSKQSKKDHHKRNMRIGGIIIVSILAVIVGGVVYVFHEGIENHKRVVERGCTPTAFNQFGIITAWTCPAGVTP